MIFLHDEGNKLSFSIADSYTQQEELARPSFPAIMSPKRTSDVTLIFTGRKTPVEPFIKTLDELDQRVIISALVKMLGGAIHISGNELLNAFTISVNQWKTDIGGLWLKVEDE